MKTPAQITIWALEIQQLKIAHEATRAEFARCQLVADQHLGKLHPQRAEIARQEAAFALAIGGGSRPASPSEEAA